MRNALFLRIKNLRVDRRHRRYVKIGAISPTNDVLKVWVRKAQSAFDSIRKNIVGCIYFESVVDETVIEFIAILMVFD